MILKNLLTTINYVFPEGRRYKNMDLTKEVDEFLKTRRLRNAKQVNENGYCREFADAIKATHSNVRVGITDPHDPSINGHYFIVGNDGLFYDSEAPQGVKRPSELKYFKRRSPTSFGK